MGTNQQNNQYSRNYKEDRWFNTVKNPRTGDFLQWYDLRQLGIEPPNEEIGKRKYPVKKVTTILRIQASDDKEYIASNQTWTGLDRLGNEVPKSFDSPEVWLRPVLNYEMKKVNPNDSFSRVERKVTGIASQVKEFLTPFSAKALDELYAKAPGSGRSVKKDVSLVIVRLGSDGEKSGNPYSIEKYEDFRGRNFDELYDYASTPRQPIDTKMGKEEFQNNNKQYG